MDTKECQEDPSAVDLVVDTIVNLEPPDRKFSSWSECES